VQVYFWTQIPLHQEKNPFKRALETAEKDRRLLASTSRKEEGITSQTKKRAGKLHASGCIDLLSWGSVKHQKCSWSDQEEKEKLCFLLGGIPHPGKGGVTSCNTRKERKGKKLSQRPKNLGERGKGKNYASHV